MKSIGLIVATSVVAAGCSGGLAPDSTLPVDTAAAATTSAPSAPSSTIPGRLLIDLDEDAVRGVIAEAARDLGLDVADLQPVVAVAVTWSDDSLNCSQRGEENTGSPIDGLWVVLTDGSRIYDYRAGEDGVFHACEGGGPPANTRVDS